ncbi:MAG: glycosyl hydrolase, partial [Proteobacteria bacterium]|nr:glycosyl hydrolase [Pseudomonadota bacterium]
MMAKILIAEDERDIRDLITLTLRFAGHEVVATPNGEEAFLKAQEVTPDLYSGLRWRHIGPPGNRASAVVGVPGDPMVSFIGAASGGVWKTTDGGLNWKPTFDDQPAQSIGAMAIAPSDPNIVWVGTGEDNNRQSSSWGAGVFKSTDGGLSWTRMGLEETRHIGRVVIDPDDHEVVYVAADGHLWGPNPERGVFKTTDGGATWTHVL